jgi:hypothetical protein
MLTRSLGMWYSMSYADPGLKMQEHLLTAPGILVICVVTHPRTNPTRCCLTLVIKWVPVCSTCQDAVQRYRFNREEKKVYSPCSASMHEMDHLIYLTYFFA